MIFFIAFLGAITPGPDILLVLRQTLKSGVLAGLQTLCGIATGWIFYISILYFGFAHLLGGEVAQIAIAFFGGIYLLYLAFLLFASKENIDLSAVDSASKSPYFTGLLINLSNPKAMLFFSAIIAPFSTKSPALHFALLFLGLNVAFLCVIFTAHFARHLITGRLFFIIDKVCAVVFCAFGVGLLAMGVEKCL
ncbi:LysE family translocator [Helicobacter sp. 23-1045]